MSNNDYVHRHFRNAQQGNLDSAWRLASYLDWPELGDRQALSREDIPRLLSFARVAWRSDSTPTTWRMVSQPQVDSLP